MESKNLQPITGIIVRVSNSSTVHVATKVTKVHPLYRKRYSQVKTYVAHDPSGTAKVDDQVTIVMCRPISKTKHWTILGK